MPTQILPGPGSEAIQSITLPAAPSTPYVLRATIPLPAGTSVKNLGVRNGPDPTAWWPTAWLRVARTKDFDYYEVVAGIESGTDAVFEIDKVTEPSYPAGSHLFNHYGLQVVPPPCLINADAWEILNRPNALIFSVQLVGANGQLETHDVSLTGGFGMDDSADPFGAEGEAPGRMWRTDRQQFGWHRWSGLARTLYKHVAIQAGGAYGYLHVFATVQAYSPEIQFEINYHQGGFEERNQPSQVLLNPTSGESQGGREETTFVDPYGNMRGNDVIFSRIFVKGFSTLDPADGFAGAWTLTPRLMQGGNPADSAFALSAAGTNSQAICKRVNVNNANERHVLPITFERAWRFAVHPTGSVTPYAKFVTGMANWQGGGWGFGPLGKPNLSNNPAIDLADQATAARTMLQSLLPYQVEQQATSGHTGMNPASFFLPGSYDVYGGSTSGTGMWPYYGQKTAELGTTTAQDILLVEQLRGHSRMYGAIYANISGHPVAPTRFAPAGVAPWRMVDRRFERTSQGILDQPFRVSSNAINNRKVHLASYNPGPVGTQFQQADLGTASDPTPNVPDWWAGGPSTGGPIACDAFNGTLPIELPLSHSLAPNVTDLAVPVILQISGAGAFNSAKSLTLKIEGEGEFDIAAEELLTITGPSANIPQVQAVQSVDKWKKITKLSITAKSGTLLATELLTVGRASIGIADYHGANAITCLDDQHSVRYHAIDKTLAILYFDTLGVLYSMMSGALAQMTWWEKSGAAKRLVATWNGGFNRGSPLARDTAWCIDRACTAIALWNGRFESSTVDLFWRSWTDFLDAMFRNMRLPNKLWQSISGKEFKQPPLGTSSFEEDDKVFFGFAGRELSYFLHAFSMLISIKGRSYSALQRQVVEAATPFKDYLWKTLGGNGTGIYNYVPHSLVTRNGVIVNPDAVVQAADTWTNYLTQAEIPAANPISGCLLNPATFPTVDDDRFVAEVAGTAITPGTPLTLANAASDTGGPAPVRLTINGGTTYAPLSSLTAANRKRRTFRIVGTCPLGAFCDDARFVAEKDGNTIVALTPLTLANTTVGGGQARKVEVSLFAGTTFTSPQLAGGKSITFRIVGTNALDQAIEEFLVCNGSGSIVQRWRSANSFKTVTMIQPSSITGALASTEKFRIGTPTKLMVCEGKGTAAQVFQSYQHFATITSIAMLTTTEAARTAAPDSGTLLVTELFRFGVPEVGLKQFSTSFPGLEANPIGQEMYHPYGLAVIKHYADLDGDAAEIAAIDECIKRYASAGSLAAAKTAMESWGEYSGGPTNRLEQWAPLLWALRNA